MVSAVTTQCDVLPATLSAVTAQHSVVTAHATSASAPRMLQPITCHLRNNCVLAAASVVMQQCCQLLACHMWCAWVCARCLRRLRL